MIKWAYDYLISRGLGSYLLSGRARLGYCPVCVKCTFLLWTGDQARDRLLCIRCRSTPRHRGVLLGLERYVPGWRQLRIHESSPDGGASSARIRSECAKYLATQFFPDVPLGGTKDGVRCENMERQTFADESFDLVLTQDVFEHILDPARGFAEVARTLRPGGVHLFTTPWFSNRHTVVRAVADNGSIRYLEEPAYHGNPIDDKGSLVVTDWGHDLADFIYRCSGMMTAVATIKDGWRGIEGEHTEVFISRKPAAPSRAAESEIQP